jgi:flagellar biosynthetic protein FliP
MIQRKKIGLKVFFVFAAVLAASPLAAQQQQFPQGSTPGTMEMSPPSGVIDFPMLNMQISRPESGREVAFSIQLLLLITIITLAPSILILVTCFLRLSIVLDFIKRALSLQQVPPTAVLNGIAFFMTLFIMWPTFQSVYEDSFRPLSQGEIALEEAFTRAASPMRMFMFNQMSGNQRSITLFMSMGNLPRPRTLDDVPTHVLIPAYILHELTVAFQIGILLYIPFIIIDMVVASVLMSMGMIMLPPVQISMPFKLMLFVLIDGWGLLTQQLFNSIAR